MCYFTYHDFVPYGEHVWADGLFVIAGKHIIMQINRVRVSLWPEVFLKQVEV